MTDHIKQAEACERAAELRFHEARLAADVPSAPQWQRDDMELLRAAATTLRSLAQPAPLPAEMAEMAELEELEELEKVASDLRFGICTLKPFGIASLGDVDTATTERRMQVGADLIERLHRENATLLARLAEQAAALAALQQSVAPIVKQTDEYDGIVIKANVPISLDDLRTLRFTYRRLFGAGGAG